MLVNFTCFVWDVEASPDPLFIRHEPNKQGVTCGDDDRGQGLPTVPPIQGSILRVPIPNLNPVTSTQGQTLKLQPGHKHHLELFNIYMLLEIVTK